MVIKKRASYSIEFTMLVILLLGAYIIMQMYVKRVFQGRLRSIGEDYGREYGYGVSKSTEQVINKRKSFTIAYPGWGHPWDFKREKGDYLYSSNVSLLAPEQMWEPEGVDE